MTKTNEKIKILDVTLRESIYINGIHISIQNAQKYVSLINKSNIDYIEIGYVRAACNGNNDNLASYCPKNYIQIISSTLRDNSITKLSVMMYPNEFKTEFLDRIRDSSIKLIRLCISCSEVNKALGIIKLLKKESYRVSVNFTRISKTDINLILRLIPQLVEADVDYIYFADSNGALLPFSVRNIYSEVIKNTTIELGYHAHNNLNFASSNTIIAIECGVKIIDASILGLGKGCSNLQLETFVYYLKKCGLVDDYYIYSILETSFWFCQNILCEPKKSVFTSKFNNTLMGLLDVNYTALAGNDNSIAHLSCELLNMLQLNQNNEE